MNQVQTSSGAQHGDHRGVVLITGASGFVGTGLIKKLAERYRVVGLDRAGPPDPAAPAEAVDMDVTSDESVLKALEEVKSRFGARIASVIHLAGYFDLSGEENPLYEKVTVEGTRRLLQHLQSLEVEQFVFASSMLVHKATGMGERINEDSPIAASWAYPNSKIRTEEVVRETHGKIPAVLLRIAGVYDDFGHNAFLAQQISRIYEKQLTSHFYPGMLCTAQAFVHLEDLAEAVLDTVERRHDLPDVLPILVGEPEALGYDEIQDTVGCALYGEAWTTLKIPKTLAEVGAWLQDHAAGDDAFIRPWMVEHSNDHYILDVSRAGSVLGWRARRYLGDTLPRIVEALKANPVAWYKDNGLDPAPVAGRGGGEAAPAQAGGAGMAQADTTPGADPMAEMERDERRSRWAHLANVALGLWLAGSGLIYGMAGSAGANIAAVTVERHLPAVAARITALTVSDVASGLAIAMLGLLSLNKRTAWWAQWANVFVGLWLFVAPLIFWAPSAAVYVNDTLVGALVITFAVLVPMMPGMSMAGMMDQSSIPPGWRYSPSTDAQRLPIAAMALIGILISRYLTAYQLGHIDHVWEPFFTGEHGRNATETIITSSVSKAWPIPDAGLGMVAYTLELLMAVMGDRRRWRTMPWMVTFFGILVVPLGVISIYFIIIQPIVIGTWCTLCLLAALAMLVMIPLSLDELVAMGQFLVDAVRRGKPLIRTFLQGDAIDNGAIDTSDGLTSPKVLFQEMVRGVTVPWTLAVSVGLGVWLMFTRVTLHAKDAMADSDHLSGALVITIAFIAFAEVARPVRFLNVMLGAWLVASPWLLQGASPQGRWASALVGVALIGLSLRRGRRSGEHYAGWDRYVF